MTPPVKANNRTIFLMDLAWASQQSSQLFKQLWDSSIDGCFMQTLTETGNEEKRQQMPVQLFFFLLGGSFGILRPSPMVR